MAEDVIDIAVFTDLQDSMGADFAAELVATFLQEAPGMLAELKAAADDDDAEGFRRAAHSIKSNANIFGAAKLADLAKKMELDGHHPGGVDAIEVAFSRAQAALRALIDG